MKQDGCLWQISVTVHEDAAADLDRTLEEAGALAVTMFELEHGTWNVTALFDDHAEQDGRRTSMDRALDATTGTAPVTIERVGPRDWIAETVKAFPPRTVGPFIIHGSHSAPVDSEAIPILMDAGTAFGSGEHPTTESCLLALAAMVERGFRPRRVLDMGCGSGILAIAAVKLCDCCALAVDIDPAAVAFALEAVRANGIAQRIPVVEGDGFAAPGIAGSGPFDLVFANILARPLATMAGDLADALAPGGRAILAGLLDSQADSVLDACRRSGLSLTERIDQAPWATLIMSKDRFLPSNS